MYKILKKKALNPTVTLMEIEAPLIAKKAEPGQFIILRVDERGERIPLTVAGYDRARGSVTIIFQIVGASTELLNRKEEGESIQDFVGPLGTPTETDGYKKVCIVGGRRRMRDRAPDCGKIERERMRGSFDYWFPFQRSDYSCGGISCLQRRIPFDDG